MPEYGWSSNSLGSKVGGAFCKLEASKQVVTRIVRVNDWNCFQLGYELSPRGSDPEDSIQLSLLSNLEKYQVALCFP